MDHVIKRDLKVIEAILHAKLERENFFFRFLKLFHLWSVKYIQKLPFLISLWDLLYPFHATLKRSQIPLNYLNDRFYS